MAILPLEPIPHLLSEIREALEDSSVLYPVNPVDLADSSEDFVRALAATRFPPVLQWDAFMLHRFTRMGVAPQSQAEPCKPNYG